MKYLLLLLSIVSIGYSQIKNVVAYYPQWAVCDMPPQKIDMNAVTHIIYFWGEPTNTPPYFSLVAGSSDSVTFETGQPGWCPSVIAGKTQQQILRDSATAHGVKLILCVGGEWGGPTSTFAAMIADTVKQDLFIGAALGWCQRHGYQGMDIDWEFAGRGVANRQMFNRFLYKVRAILNTWTPQRGLLTMAMPTWFWWDGAKTDPYIDVKTVNDCFDFVDLMEYGMENTSAIISHHGPLYSNPFAKQEAWDTRGIKEWSQAGVKTSIICPLIPFEGLRMTDISGISPVAIGHIATNNGWTQAKTVPSGATVMFDSIAKNTWAYSGTSFWSFEDSRSMTYKVNYALSKGVTSVGVWELWQGWNPNITPHDAMLQSLKAIVKNQTPPPIDTIIITPPPPPVNPVATITVSSNVIVLSDSIKISGICNVGVQFFDTQINKVFVWNGTGNRNTSSNFSMYWKPNTDGMDTILGHAQLLNGQWITSNIIIVTVKPSIIIPPPTITNCDSAYQRGKLDGIKSVICQTCPPLLDTLVIIRRALARVPDSLKVLVPKPVY